MPAYHPHLLPEHSIVCSIVAACKYQIPVNILLAIAEKEGGRPGQWSKNSNGTYDVGIMQFNTTYIKELTPHGVTAKDLAANNCYPFDVAAWRLRHHLQEDRNDLFTRAANYHSKTPKYNAIYRADLIKKAAKWQVWVEQRFKTYPVTYPTLTPLKMSTTQSPSTHSPSHLA